LAFTDRLAASRDRLATPRPAHLALLPPCRRGRATRSPAYLDLLTTCRRRRATRSPAYLDLATRGSSRPRGSRYNDHPKSEADAGADGPRRHALAPAGDRPGQGARHPPAPRAPRVRARRRDRLALRLLRHPHRRHDATAWPVDL